MKWLRSTMGKLNAGAAWVAVLWGLAIANLSWVWRSDPQYDFGWLVPAMAALLAWRRWETAPVPGRPVPTHPASIWVVTAVAGVSWLLAWPAPEWRLLNALLATSAVIGTFLRVISAGGRSWVMHFAFPTLFLFAAVPLPGAIEQPILNSLTSFVAEATATVLTAFFGTPALARGAVVELASGPVGVDEACSGIRSLHASVVAALFLGEFYRFTLLRRTMLAGAGVAAAVLGNLCRTVALGLGAAAGGGSPRQCVT
jgi:exosortase